MESSAWREDAQGTRCVLTFWLHRDQKYPTKTELPTKPTKYTKRVSDSSVCSVFSVGDRSSHSCRFVCFVGNLPWVGAARLVPNI